MKTPLRNIMAILTGDVGSRAIGFLVTVYLARIFAPASFGLINIGLAVLGYLSLLNSPGIQILEARNAAAVEGGMLGRAGAILSLRLILAPVLLGATWIAVAAAGLETATREVILLYGCSLIPMALCLDWLFQGKENFRVITASRILNACVYAGLVVLLVRSDADVRLTAVAFLIGNAAATLYLGIMYRRRYGPLPMGWDPGAWRGILKENLPVGAAMLLAQSVTNLPPLVIGIILTNTDVGVYSAAMKLAFVILIIDRTLSALFLPVATRYAVARTDEFPRLLSITIRALLTVLVPLLVAVCIVAVPVVQLIFGPGYEAAVAVFRVLTGYVFLTMLNSLFLCTLIALRKTKEYATIVAAGAMLIVAGVILLTALVGVTGAAWGIICGEFAILFMLARAASRSTRLPARRELVKPIGAGALMIATAVSLSGAHPAVSLLCSLLVFGATLILAGGFPREDLRYLKERLV